MRVVVTGGAGFIGSHIVDILLMRGHEPVVIDDFSSGFRGNVPSEVETHDIDIASELTAQRVANLKPDAVIHAAAQSSVSGSMSEPERDRAINLIGTQRVIEGAKLGRAKRIVFLSTGGGIYGETDTPATETMIPRPKSFYSVHKYAAERYVELSGLGYAIARLSNVYGPRQRSHLEGGVVAIFAERLAQGLPIIIYGNGEQTRDLIHVADVCDAMMRMLEANLSDIWNVASGTETTINGLLDVMQKVIRPAGYIGNEPAREGDVFRSRLSSAKIRLDLGWQPRYPLAKGVATVLAHGS